ncbi:hypothetical protein GGI07_003497 [Coemansia sp. Benny D115]|nr:hypothetical protein GGI07_003497 [Coemansia sp. Benny D115]
MTERLPKKRIASRVQRRLTRGASISGPAASSSNGSGSDSATRSTRKKPDRKQQRGHSHSHRAQPSSSPSPSPSPQTPAQAEPSSMVANMVPIEEGSSTMAPVDRILIDTHHNGMHYFQVVWSEAPSQSESGDASQSKPSTAWLSKDSFRSCPDLVEQYLRSKEQNTADLTPFRELLRNAQADNITVANTVDDVGGPDNFTYINTSIYAEDIPRPCTPLRPCRCVDRCESDCECVRHRYYNSKRQIITDASIQVLECGPWCTCGPDCVTRVVQKGPNVQLEVFRTAFKGWGVRARQLIQKGTFVAEYVGEIISFEEAERRGYGDETAGLTYLFDLDMAFLHGEPADFTIDAKTHGNVSHFFNHSCDPNMEIRQVYIEHRDPRLHRIAFFARKDIAPGDEMTFDYTNSIGDDDHGGAPRDAGPRAFSCFCGTKRCSGYIPF